MKIFVFHVTVRGPKVYPRIALVEIDGVFIQVEEILLKEPFSRKPDLAGCQYAIHISPKSVFIRTDRSCSSVVERVTRKNSSNFGSSDDEVLCSIHSSSSNFCQFWFH